MSASKYVLDADIAVKIASIKGRNYTDTNIELSRFVDLSVLWLFAANAPIYVGF